MWYAFQLAIMMYVMHVYKTEIAPDAQSVHVAFIAVCVAYAATWFLSWVFRITGKLFSLIGHVLNLLSGKKPSDQLPVNVTRSTNGTPRIGVDIR